MNVKKCHNFNSEQRNHFYQVLPVTLPFQTKRLGDILDIFMTCLEKAFLVT